MKRVYFLPNLITTLGLACGLLVIFKMAMAQPGMVGYPILRTSVLLLIVASIADLLDGAIARLFKMESDFGALFDSLSDAVTFGVAPAVLALKSLNVYPQTPLGIVASIGAMLYAVCGVLRLVRYNVYAKEGNSRLQPITKYRIFIGLPIPAAAIALIALSLFFASPQLKRLVEVGELTRVITVTAVMILLGYLMISRIIFPGIKAFHFRLWPTHLILVTVAVTVLGFYGLLYYFPFIFAILAWGYLAIAALAATARLLSKKRETKS
ncbi:MAG: phosphatidylcholine/phosphatidylserine synthase [Parachlamydiales bacterium]